MDPRKPYRAPHDDLHPDASLVGAEKMTIRTVPEVRKKNKHLDEIYKLKQDIISLQDENDKLHMSIGKMALDLDKAEKQIEATHLEHKSSDTGREALQKQVDKLSAELERECGIRQDLEKGARGRETEGEKYEKECLRLQAEVTRLTLAAHDKDTQMRELDQKLVEARTNLSGSTTNAMQEISRLTSQLQQETRLRDIADQQLKSLQEQSASTSTAELQELRQQCDFYQKNSERLSKELMQKKNNASRVSKGVVTVTETEILPPWGQRHMPGQYA